MHKQLQQIQQNISVQIGVQLIAPKRKFSLRIGWQQPLGIFSYKRYEMCLASLPSQSSKANETVGGERDMTPLLHMKPKFSKD
jgi:hypothetical protein